MSKLKLIKQSCGIRESVLWVVDGENIFPVAETPKKRLELCGGSDYSRNGMDATNVQERLRILAIIFICISSINGKLCK